MTIRPRIISRQNVPKRTHIMPILSEPYSGHSVHSAIGSRMNGIVFRSFQKRNRSQKNTNTVYSMYSYSGIVPKERALNLSLSLNRYIVTDIFEFNNEIRNLGIVYVNGDILVSYYLSSLFTNVPLGEMIEILANKAFNNNWFNTTHYLNLTRTDLVELLNVATKGQLFQFNGALYQQTHGDAMGSPLGPLLANVFISIIEGNLEREGKPPQIETLALSDSC